MNAISCKEKAIYLFSNDMLHINTIVKKYFGFNIFISTTKEEIYSEIINFHKLSLSDKSFDPDYYRPLSINEFNNFIDDLKDNDFGLNELLSFDNFPDNLVSSLNAVIIHFLNDIITLKFDFLEEIEV